MCGFKFGHVFAPSSPQLDGLSSGIGVLGFDEHARVAFVAGLYNEW